MARSGNGEGTIRKRADGRWETRVVLADGTRKSFYGKTRHEVVRLRQQAIQRRDQGMAILDDQQTVAEYSRLWIRAERHRVKWGSWLKYEREVRLRIIPGLGKVILSKLSAQQVERFCTRELEHGASPLTVRYCRKVLYAAFQDALRLGLVYRNVAALVDPPRKGKRQMAVYTEEQSRTLLDSVMGDRLEALCVLALATGMREGELLALTWDDVDIERAVARVHATLQRTPDGLKREEAKTDHSERSVALSRAAVDALQGHRLRQAEERLRLGEAWTSLNLVFPNTIGGPIIAQHFRDRWWYPLLERAGLPRIRFHDLRHTAATLLLARGINVKVVSEMLGHSNIAITLAIYGHVLPHMQQHAAQQMDEIIGTRSSQGSKRGSIS
jgi:integrase